MIKFVYWICTEFTIGWIRHLTGEVIRCYNARTDNPIP